MTYYEEKLQLYKNQRNIFAIGASEELKEMARAIVNGDIGLDDLDTIRVTLDAIDDAIKDYDDAIDRAADRLAAENANASA